MLCGHTMGYMELALTPGMAELTPASREAVIVCGIVLVVVLAMGAAVLWIKRRFPPGSQLEASGGLSIEDVERLHELGHVSREEFEALRRIALKVGPPFAKTEKSALTPRADVDDESMAPEDPAPQGPEGA